MNTGVRGYLLNKAMSSVNPVSRQASWISFYESLLPAGDEEERQKLCLEKGLKEKEEINRIMSAITPDAGRAKESKRIFEGTLKDMKLDAEKLNLEEYEKLLPLLRLSYAREQNGTPEEQAIKLIIAFGSAGKAIDYLKKFEKNRPTEQQPVHQACLFSIPVGDWTLKIWQELANQFMLDKRFQRAFARANNLEEYIKANKEVLSKEIRREVESEFKKKFEEQYNREHPNDPKAYLNSYKNAIYHEVSVAIDKEVRKELEFGDGSLTPEQQEQLEKRKKSFSKDHREKMQKIRKSIEDKYLQHYTPPTPEERKKFISEKLRGVEKEIEEEVEKRLFSGSITIEQIENYYRHATYKRHRENEQAARIFSEVGITEASFNEYLTLKPKDSPHIPPLLGSEDKKKSEELQILVKGSDIGYDDEYYLTKLPPDDPRCAVLGHYTSCCQHLDGAGRECAVHGIISENGGFYVLCKKKKRKNPPNITDDIVSQCWAWRSKEGAIVLDSIETVTHYRNGGGSDKQEMVADFFSYWGNKLVTEHGISRVLVGASNTPRSLGSLLQIQLEEPIDYSGYRDSIRQQRLVALDPKLILAALKEKSRTLESCGIKYRTPSRTRWYEREDRSERWYYTPLQLVAEIGTPQMIEQVFKERSDKQFAERDVEWDTLFIFAVENSIRSGRIKNLETLLNCFLEKGVNALIKRDVIGRTPLLVAITNQSDLNLVRFLLGKISSKEDLENILTGPDENGELPLVAAASKSNPEILKVVLEYAEKWNVDVAQLMSMKGGEHNETPLMAAIKAKPNNHEIISILLEKISEVSKENAEEILTTHDKYGNSPLVVAASKSNSEILKMVLEYAEKQSLNIVHLMSKKGGKHKETPLMAAMRADPINYEIISILLEKMSKASKENAEEILTTPDKYGNSPLIVAAKGDPKILKMVLEYAEKQGVDIVKLMSMKGEFGQTPLMAAVIAENYDNISILLEKIDKVSREKAEGILNVATKHGDSPLTKAFEIVIDRRADLRILSTILEYAVKKNVTNFMTIEIGDFKKRPLIAAIEAGRYNIDVVSVLLEKMSKVSMSKEEAENIFTTPDKNGNLPLIAAVKSGNQKILKMLIEYAGSKQLDIAKIINTESNLTGRRETPLTVAIDTDSPKPEIISILLENMSVSKESREKMEEFFAELVAITIERSSSESLEMLLDYAVRNNLDIAKIMNMKGGKYAQKPLMAAVRKDRINLKIISILLKSMSNVSKVKAKEILVTDDGYLLLVLAINRADPEILKMLLDYAIEKDLDVAELMSMKHGGFEQTPLMAAIDNSGSKENIFILLEKMSKISGEKVEDILTAADKNGNSPLGLVVERADPEILEMLLEYAVNRNLDIVKLVSRDIGKQRAPLMVAIDTASPNYEIVSILLKKISKMSKQKIEKVFTTPDKDGNLPLITAVRRADPKVLKMLLACAESNGLDITKLANMQAGKLQQTPLMAAIEAVPLNFEIIAILLEKMSKVSRESVEELFNTPDKNKRLILVSAVQRLNPRLLKVLFEYAESNGLDIAKLMSVSTVGGKYIQSPLMAAIQWRGTPNPEIVSALLGKLSRESDIISLMSMKEGPNERTPLMAAVSVYEPNLEIIAMLLEKMSKLSKENVEGIFAMADIEGNLPLGIVVRQANTAVLKILLEYAASKGLDIAKLMSMKEGELEQTPLRVAIDADEPNLEIIAMLLEKMSKLSKENVKKILTELDKDGNSALVAAAKKGNPEVLKKLLDCADSREIDVSDLVTKMISDSSQFRPEVQDLLREYAKKARESAAEVRGGGALALTFAYTPDAAARAPAFDKLLKSLQDKIQALEKLSKEPSSEERKTEADRIISEIEKIKLADDLTVEEKERIKAILAGAPEFYKAQINKIFPSQASDSSPKA